MNILYKLLAILGSIYILQFLMAYVLGITIKDCDKIHKWVMINFMLFFGGLVIAFGVTLIIMMICYAWGIA